MLELRKARGMTMLKAPDKMLVSHDLIEPSRPKGEGDVICLRLLGEGGLLFCGIGCCLRAGESMFANRFSVEEEFLVHIFATAKNGWRQSPSSSVGQGDTKEYGLRRR